MEPLLHGNWLLQNSPAFRQLLANCGDSSKEHRGEVLEAAITVYKAAIEDVPLQPAAFGIAVSIISNNLEVSIRAAALILSALLDVQKPD